MPLFIQYLLKFSISLALVYLFYQSFLRRLTFYNCNRWYLLGYLLVSFIIPFINISPLVENNDFSSAQIIHYIPVFDKYANNAGTTISWPVSHDFFHLVYWWNIVLLILITGSLCLMIRLCMQFFSLQKIKKQATKINDAAVAVYHVEKSIIPFSFGNNIYINQHLHTEKELEDIILHEYVHVKQKHTIDILLAELLCIFNWYNPFAWLIRKAIRQNLEFIADNKVLQTGMDKKNYQYHLLKVTGMPQYAIASNFNFSSLKKRIAMMNKMKTAKVHLLRFLFVLPLFAVVLLAFRNNAIGKKQMNQMVLSPVVKLTDTIPSAKDDSGEIIVESVQQKDSIVKITRKNGKTETYDLRNPVQKKAFEKKYDVLVRDLQSRQKEMEQEFNKMNKELIDSKQMQENQSAAKEMQMRLNEKMKEINAAQEAWKKDMEIGSDTSYDQLLAQKAVMEDMLKMQMDSAFRQNMILDKLIPVQEDLLKEKLMLEQYYNSFKNNQDKLKTTDKILLKKMQEELRMQRRELQRNLEELRLRELEIEKRLKQVNDKVSYKRAGKNTDGFSQRYQYVDNVSVQNGMMYWAVNKDYPKHPLFLVDGKQIGNDENMVPVNPDARYSTEFVTKGDILKNYGDAGRDGLINIITKTNKDNPSAHILGSNKFVTPGEIKNMELESASLNKLYIGKENPLKISVVSIDDKELVVQIDKGCIIKRNGLYYAYPSVAGNAEIRIFQKKSDGSLKLLNARYFRVENLSDLQTSAHTNNS